MFRSNPIIDRFVDFFGLPNCYLKIISFGECKKAGLSIVLDLLELYFGYKTFPDHYGPCRLWEVKKDEWKYYYGSNYRSYQRARLRRKVQPSEYTIVFDDKSICESLCREIGVNMPHTLGVIRAGENYEWSIETFFNNSESNVLFVKPLRGAAGRGIVLAKRSNHNIFILSKKEVVPIKYFNLLEDCIVQEVIKQDNRMSAMSKSSVNTIRVVTMYTEGGEVIILGATMRCGVGESYVDNWTAGGIAVGINHKTGELKKNGYNKNGKRFTEHPTSRVVFDAFIIPEWKRIIDVAVKVQKAFPFYRILGMDIALEEKKGPVLIEVNDNTDLLFQEQTSGALLRSEAILRAFGEYDLFVNKHQRRLFNGLNRTSC